MTAAPLPTPSTAMSCFSVCFFRVLLAHSRSDAGNDGAEDRQSHRYRDTHPDRCADCRSSGVHFEDGTCGGKRVSQKVDSGRDGRFFFKKMGMMSQTSKTPPSPSPHFSFCKKI